MQQLTQLNTLRITLIHNS